ncbi:hypothetical protein D621_03145 [beta proteobacterium AAP51]|nr:hypothetical protein D621_03145 [beta proteobacterium AAP51]
MPQIAPNRIIGRTSAALALALGCAAAQPAPTTQLGLLLDASGSVTAQIYQTLLQGAYRAVDAMPTDGSIELTIMKFSTVVSGSMAPTVLTSATKSLVLNTLTALSSTQDAALSNNHLGVQAISQAMTSSSHFNPGIRSIISILTDGGVPGDQTATTSAALAAEMAGIDALTAVVAGSTGFLFNNAGLNYTGSLVFSPLCAAASTQCGAVFASGTTPTDPMASAGWVALSSTSGDVARGIGANLASPTVLVSSVPEPGSLALAGLALAALTLKGRRRKV